MVDANALMNAGLLVATGLAFSKLARYELLKRDKWTCQNDDCVGFYMNMGALQYKDGWMVNGAHYPDLHQEQKRYKVKMMKYIIETKIRAGERTPQGVLTSVMDSSDWSARNGASFVNSSCEEQPACDLSASRLVSIDLVRLEYSLAVTTSGH